MTPHQQYNTMLFKRPGIISKDLEHKKFPFVCRIFFQSASGNGKWLFSVLMIMTMGISTGSHSPL